MAKRNNKPDQSPTRSDSAPAQGSTRKARTKSPAAKDAAGGKHGARETAKAAGTRPQQNRAPIFIDSARGRRLDIRLAAADITQVEARAVVLGLYQGVAPSGPAAALDGLLGRAISDFVDRNMLSGSVGEIFLLPTGRHPVSAEVVVFAGLGRFETFDESALQTTAEHVARSLARLRIEDFATVLIGSASGIKLKRSLECLLRGFLAALRDHGDPRAPRIITFVELDPDRYKSLRSALRKLAKSGLFGEFVVTIDEIFEPERLQKLPPAESASPASDANEKAKESLYLFAHQEPGSLVEVDHLKRRIRLRYAVLTAGTAAAVLRTELAVDATKLEAAIAAVTAEQISVEAQSRAGIELAELLLPPSLRETLVEFEDRPLVLIHDALTSMIPWESMGFRRDGSKTSAGFIFPAKDSGWSRRYDVDGLTPARWLDQRRRDPEARVLLVYNPTIDLPGAEEEGERLLAKFKAHGRFRELRAEFELLKGAEVTRKALREKLGSGRYDLVHFAGHAIFDSRNPAASGIICAGWERLTGSDLAQLGRLPALMVFNACESLRLRNQSKEGPAAQQDRLAEALEERSQRGARSPAESLLMGGVANLVGTFRPVSDEAALEFAMSFYELILAGQTIGEAILATRQALYEKGRRDWANYIHYGSASFRLKEIVE